MTARLYRGLAVVTMLVSSAAMAQETQASGSGVHSGLEFTVGLGFQAGAGYVYKNGPRADRTVGDVKLSDAANGGVAFLLEAGYRASPNWFIGAFGQYTYVLTKNNPYTCPEGLDCNTGQIRFGPQVQYHFAPDASFDPFLGVGFGFVILGSTVEGTQPVPLPDGSTVPAGVDINSIFRGPEFINATIGGKWRLSNSLSFGPYLTGTYARYTVRVGTQKLTVPAQGGTTFVSDLPPVDDGPYGLVILGVRGTFNL